MGDNPPVECQMEEGSPFQIEGRDSSSEPTEQNDDTGEENLYPFDNLAVEFYEGPDEDSGVKDGSANNSQNYSNEEYNGDDTVNSMEQDANDDSVASDSLDSSAVINDGLGDPDYKELQKTYLQNFMYSGASSFDEGSNSNFDDTKDEPKGTPLSRFAKIAKAVEIADYETLQVLYQLLYQRSAWDTQEILIHRILEFCGFSVNEKSEDYFNREMMLKTQPNEVLVKIGAILGLEQIQKVLQKQDNGREQLISSIMFFLSRPSKKTRNMRPDDIQSSNNSVQKALHTNCGCRNGCFKKFSKAQQTRLLEYIIELQTKKLLDSYLVKLIECKKIIRKPGSQDDCKKLKEVMYIYSCRFNTKEAVVCKGAFCVLHGIKMGRINQIQNRLKLKKNVPAKLEFSDFPPILREGDIDLMDPVEETKTVSKPSPQKQSPEAKIAPKDKVWVSSEEQVRRLEEEMKSNVGKQTVVPKVVIEKFDVKDLDKAKESEKLLEKKEKEAVSIAKKENVKLKDFSLVVNKIEDASEEMLIDVHHLLFLNSAETEQLKNNILEFGGFTFDSDTEDYDERCEFLQRMSFKIVSEVAISFSLEVLGTKEETIKNILSFLTSPGESFIKETTSMPFSLSDVELDDLGDLSDSDVSITCEVTEKNVECIDLISSGEESDGEGKPRKKKSIQKVAPLQPPIQPQPLVVPQTPVAPLPESVTQSAPDSQTSNVTGGTRMLRNFETICKIVNTHPHEYLIDIFDLLYLKKHEPTTLRADILDFTGFDFERTSTDFIKRKQLLDRMLYNSVRRIYNTLIHNTTEVKVFSKPTMITEIFQFLFKLPDHDTSIRPTANKPAAKPTFLQSAPLVKNTPGVVTPPTGLNLPNQTGKLSDLKRVFQRVACFPCEYLIDVHKLLFMTDCDPKVIRPNIFAFKGFSFSAESQDFLQRKMYLEYLTFHSLRKISSVLTTRSVDLRNSTKHELATHLTQVLAEYCDTVVEDAGAPGTVNQTAVTSTTETNVPAVENIVVTPIIDPSLAMNSAESSKSAINDDDQPGPQLLSISIIDARSVSSPAISTKATTPAPKARSRKRKGTPNKQNTDTSQTDAQSPFADINLPEVEQYKQMYGHIYQPNAPTIPAGVVSQSYPVLAPKTGSFIGSFPQTIQIRGAFPAIQQTGQLIGIQQQAITPTIVTQVPSKKNEIIVPGECLVNETEEPPSKKVKNGTGTDDPSSFQNKIRDAANSEDDEDCDKPLSSLVGHPIDSVLKKHIVDIVEQTDLESITINGVIQKIFNLYPKFDLSYRKEFIKSTLRAILYRLGEEKNTGKKLDKRETNSPDCSVTTTDNGVSNIAATPDAAMECS